MNHASEPLIYVAFFLVGVGLKRYVPAPPLPIGIGRVLSAVRKRVTLGPAAPCGDEGSFRYERKESPRIVDQNVMQQGL
jgi:hypothetical protein